MAKGLRCAGVEAFVAEDNQRILPTNLVGIGVLPLEFKSGANCTSVGIDGADTRDAFGMLTTRTTLSLVIHPKNVEAPVRCRFDTAKESLIYKAAKPHG